MVIIIKPGGKMNITDIINDFLLRLARYWALKDKRFSNNKKRNALLKRKKLGKDDY